MLFKIYVNTWTTRNRCLYVSDCKRNGYGVDSHFFALVTRQIAVLRSATQHATIRGKVRNEVSYQLVPTAYPAICAIQREVEKKM